MAGKAVSLIVLAALLLAGGAQAQLGMKQAPAVLKPAIEKPAQLMGASAAVAGLVASGGVRP